MLESGEPSGDQPEKGMGMSDEESAKRVFLKRGVAVVVGKEEGVGVGGFSSIMLMFVGYSNCI